MTKQQSKSPQQLEQYLFEAWREKITPEFCETLYAFMGIRMDSVIENASARINY